MASKNVEIARDGLRLILNSKYNINEDVRTFIANILTTLEREE